MANDPKFTSVKAELAKWLPMNNVPTPANKNASKDKNVKKASAKKKAS